MVNNFIGSLGQDLDQDDNRRFGQFGNQVGNLFSKRMIYDSFTKYNINKKRGKCIPLFNGID